MKNMHAHVNGNAGKPDFFLKPVDKNYFQLSKNIFAQSVINQV